jgi:predicted kinase
LRLQRLQPPLVVLKAADDRREHLSHVAERSREPVRALAQMTLPQFVGVAALSAAVEVVWARLLYRAFRTGTISDRAGDVLRRDKEPFNYWFVMSTSALFLLGFVISTIAMCVSAFAR